MKGSIKARYTAMTPGSESTWLTLSSIRYRGMMRATSGTICTQMIMTRNAVRPLNPKRAVPTAARNAIARASTNTTPTMVRLFLTSSRK